MTITKFPNVVEYLSEMPIGTVMPWENASQIPDGWEQYDELSVAELPWNLPRGRVFLDERTTSSQVAGTTQVTILTANNVPMVAGRRYKITYYCSTVVSASVTDDELYTTLVDPGGTTVQQYRCFVTAAKNNSAINLTHTYTATSTGLFTWLVRASALSGQYQHYAASIQPRYFLVEDIGADTSQAPWNEGCWIRKIANSHLYPHVITPIGTIIPWENENAIPPGFEEYPAMPIESLPWNAPLGTIDYKQITTPVAANGLDIAGLGITFDADPNRKYRFSAEAFFQGTAADDVCNFNMHNGAGSTWQQAQTCLRTASVNYSVYLAVQESGLSGSTTVQAAAGKAAGAGTITLTAGATIPAFVMVEDMGAVTPTGCWIIKVSDATYSSPDALYQVVTSSTRPTGQTGTMIYESDTDNLLVSNGTEYQKPWNLPWGVVGLTQRVGEVNYPQPAGVFNRYVWVENVPIVAGRRYRITATCNVYSPAGATNHTAELRVSVDGGSEVVLERHEIGPNAILGRTQTLGPHYYDASVSGLAEFDMWGRFDPDDGVVLVDETDRALRIAVEDVGPA